MDKSATTFDLIMFQLSGFLIALSGLLSAGFASRGDWPLSALAALTAVGLFVTMIIAAWTLSERAKDEANEAVSHQVSLRNQARSESAEFARKSIREAVLKAFDGDAAEPPA